jgi:CBS domain-containing protein
MTRNVYTISPDITIDQLISDYFLVNRHGGYPVVRDGKILGVVTLQSVRAIPKDMRSSTKVEQALSHGEAMICVRPVLSALDAMHKMARDRVGRVLVVEEGVLVGIVTRGDLMRTIQTRQELDAVRQTSTATHIAPHIGLTRDQTMKCLQCGGLVPIGSRFCPHCGALQDKSSI